MTDDVDNPRNGWTRNDEAPVLGDTQRNVVEDNCVGQATVTMALVTSCQRLLEWQQLAYDENVQLQEENDAAVEDLAKEHATEVNYLRGQRDGLREQADRHQQQIYSYLSHIKILENKYGSETAAVLNTLFGRITGLENTLTGEILHWPKQSVMKQKRRSLMRKGVTEYSLVILGGSKESAVMP